MLSTSPLKLEDTQSMLVVGVHQRWWPFSTKCGVDPRDPVLPRLQLKSPVSGLVSINDDTPSYFIPLPYSYSTLSVLYFLTDSQFSLLNPSCNATRECLVWNPLIAQICSWCWG